MIKRRLRKKKHVGDFKEMGFLLSAKLNLKSEEELDQFCDEMIDFLASNEIHMEGGMGIDNISLFIGTGIVNTGEEECRAKLITWMEEHKNVEEFNAGELEDAFYG